MRKNIILIQIMVVVLCCQLTSCEDFVEVETPAQKLATNKVFDNDETAKSALQGIYNELFRSESFCNGGTNSVTALAGLSAEELATIDATNTGYTEFEENVIQANNPHNLELWASAYHTVYMANALLEGINASSQLSPEVVLQLEGEAKCIRAFTYFYLVNLYGEVPLLLTTDYRTNAISSRAPVEELYGQILSDLEEAEGVLGEDYPNEERTKINKGVAQALLARVYLYRNEWTQAENYSTLVIQSGAYALLEDLDQVFLANSQEAIWQISPAGLGSNPTNTNEGSMFISAFPTFKLAEGVVNSFEEIDKRKLHWIGLDEENNFHYPFKYKLGTSNDVITEYSMVLRLAEQYLIRAEARAKQNNLSGAIADLDAIRTRAGVDLIADTNPEITQDALLKIIQQERFREFFTEWGHRWLDLKRTGSASEILADNNPQWEATDTLFPIPEEERLKNSNLTQNPGY